MLEKARERVARKDTKNVRLLQMDAQDLKFEDNTFDIVYAPYLISVVPDPVKVACEMRRVCKPGGRIVFRNHYLSPNKLLNSKWTAAAPVDKEKHFMVIKVIKPESPGAPVTLTVSKLVCP